MKNQMAITFEQVGYFIVVTFVSIVKNLEMLRSECVLQLCIVYTSNCLSRSDHVGFFPSAGVTKFITFNPIIENLLSIVLH